MRSLIRSFIAVAAALLVLLAPVSQARAANPAPPRTLETPGIDAHLGYIAQKTCSPAAKPGTTGLLKALLKTWGGASWGISRFCSSGGTSEHKEGRAIDWHMDSRKAKDRAKVNDMVKWMTANNGEIAYRLGVMYIIWNQKIWSIYYQELGWRKLADRGSWTANHKDHVHISLSWDGAMAQTSWWTGKVLAEAKLGPCGTKNFGTCLATIGRSSAKTWPTVTVGAFSPYPSAVPAIAGSARVGLTLRAVAGTWMPSGSNVSYQWLRNGSVVGGETAGEYTVAAADLGRSIRVRVSATLGATTVTKTSDETTDTVRGVFPTPRPVVTGSYRFGATLTGAPGAGFPGGTGFAYQWQRNGTSIARATASTYLLTAADVGRDVRLRVTVSKVAYTTTKTYSKAVDVLPLNFEAAPEPTIDGILRVGGVLTAVPGSWKPKGTFSYVWYRGGKTIKGAAKAAYTLTAADLGKAISVRVRATAPGYQAASRVSKPSVAVGAGISTATPRLSDVTLRVGQVVTVAAGSWKPSGVRFGYRWYRNGTLIAGATGRSYTVTAADYAKKLTARVEGALDGYPNAARTTAASKKVGSGLFLAGTVTVEGTPAVGQALSADVGEWRSSLNAALELVPTVSYQWLAAGKPIKGATAASYTPAAGQSGSKVQVVVTATLSRYTTASATSAAVTIG